MSETLRPELPNLVLICIIFAGRSKHRYHHDKENILTRTSCDWRCLLQSAMKINKSSNMKPENVTPSNEKIE